jgi:hypothetical protein
VEHDRPGRRRSGWAGVGRGATGAAPPWPGGAGEAYLAAATTHVEAIREREVEERKGGAGYYTRLCLSG